MSQILRTTPAPAAKEIAVRTASTRRDTPESISPDRKSLMELVRATPGTKSIRVPMMIGSYDAAGIAVDADMAINAARPQQQKPVTNELMSSLFNRREKV